MAAPPSSIFTEESSSNSMTRKDEIKPAPVVVQQNGKENKEKNHHELEKEIVLLPKPNIQRASDQKRYFWTILMLSYRGHSSYKATFWIEIVSGLELKVLQALEKLLKAFDKQCWGSQRVFVTL